MNIYGGSYEALRVFDSGRDFCYSRSASPCTTSSDCETNAGSKANASVPTSRDVAIQKCNAEAAKFSSRDFQSTNLTVYRGCMARHGQSSE